MSMPSARLLSPLGAALLAGAAAAAQTNAPAPPPGRLEATLLAGYRIEGSLESQTAPGRPVLDLGNAATFGLALDWRIDRYGDVEIQYGYTNSAATTLVQNDAGQILRVPSYDVAIHDVTFGAIVNLLGPDKPVRPYVGVGIGFSVLDPSNQFPAETKLLFSLAGGARAYLSSRFGLRFEARWVPVYLFSSGGGIDCAPLWVVCWATNESHVLQQADFRLGAILRF